MRRWLRTLPRNVFSPGLYSAACKASFVIPCEWYTVSTLVHGTRQAPAVSCNKGVEGNWWADRLSDNCQLMAVSVMGEPILEVANIGALPSLYRLVDAQIREGAWNPTDEWCDPGMEVDWMLRNCDPWWEMLGDRIDKSVKMMMKWASAFTLQGAQVWLKLWVIGLLKESAAKSSWSSWMPVAKGAPFSTQTDDNTPSDQYPYTGFWMSSPKDGTWVVVTVISSCGGPTPQMTLARSLNTPHSAGRPNRSWWELSGYFLFWGGGCCQHQC